ncbi:MAG: lysophospholipid acyltransferase family protein [Chthonomonas sp.]|nr:lysophospholipid acyltransferase family protein [Chthonomonas sp.]
MSPSRDGDLLSRLFDRLGLATIRGSTGRQGIRALIESISALKAGTSLALTPDGPRGPAEEVQDGVLAMAKKSGVPIVPMSSSAQRKSFVKSWDRFLVPMPFSRCVVVFGEPIIVEDMEVARVQLKQSMNEVQRRADELGK